MPKARGFTAPSKKMKTPPDSELNCPILCGQYKKEPLVGKIEF